MSLLIRPSREEDVPAITAIYGQAVRHGTGTFELEPPTEADMAQRRRNVLDGGWPWLVAEKDGQVVGYAYAQPFRPRRAYRFCLEDSIYLDESVRGQGLGRMLLAELISRCEQLGARQMLGVIGDAGNGGSIGLHRSLGFEPAGVLKDAGWKFERWLDVVLMQRPLGPGSTATPADR